MSSEEIISSDEMQLVTFILGQENFGINIMDVQEIIRTPAITVIPQAPEYVEGVTNLRGSILPVIDTRVRFGMNRIEQNISNRVIVVDVKGSKVGLGVDAVSEVLRVESNCIEAAPSMAGVDDGSITGVVKLNEGRKLVMILDAANLCRIETAADKGTGASVKRDLTVQQVNNKLEEVQLVTFLLGSEEFALEIEHVREIIRYPEVVKVPNVPDYIKGVISLRDILMPIVDMRIKLDTGSDAITDSTRVVVIDVDNTRIGLVVDRVYEVARIARDTIFAPPQALAGEGRDRLKGIARVDEGKRIIMLLDPADIMTREELKDIGTGDVQQTNAEYEDSIDENMDEEQMVVFKLAGEQYGVRITQVQEINRLSKITKVPRAPRFVEGVINLRGDVIPVIDLRRRFEIESKDYNEFTRVIVSDINNKKIGIIVDEVLEVLRISGQLLEEAPDILQGNQVQKFMDGIANMGTRMIMMLDLGNILVEKEWDKLLELGTQERTAKKGRPSQPRLKKQKGEKLD
jgi:purine-binding chemotaxis protein CheW